MTPARLVAAPAPPGPDLPLTLLCVAVAVGYTALALGLFAVRRRPTVPATVGRRYRRWTRAEMRRFSPVLAERMNR